MLLAIPIMHFSPYTLHFVAILLLTLIYYFHNCIHDNLVDGRVREKEPHLPLFFPELFSTKKSASIQLDIQFGFQVCVLIDLHFHFFSFSFFFNVVKNI